MLKSSPKMSSQMHSVHCVNKTIFSTDVKLLVFVLLSRCPYSGKKFQAVGPATEKARRANALSSWQLTERRRWRATMLKTMDDNTTSSWHHDDTELVADAVRNRKPVVARGVVATDIGRVSWLRWLTTRAAALSTLFVNETIFIHTCRQARPVTVFCLYGYRFLRRG